MNLSNINLLKTDSYINGEWVKSHDQKTFNVINPFTNEEIARVSEASKSQVEEAIKHAEDAFKIWRKFTAGKRSRILKKWYKLQLDNAQDLAHILTIEQGKPLNEALGEIKYGASFVEWFAEEAKRNYGDTIPGHARDKRIVTIKQPIGVVGAITPWNFPSAMITRKVAPALAAGCTVVIKPSELTPLSALALA
ncbi:MAG: aldehyde dehydrogenase family protein, partial [Saprospiraceae bacterium]|nr:aldehyde dehydrogenase family protein [Bacteroidia bacterium]NNL93412.1 aldehyde dehydrogenase family protein [Saprospiraceae bacterium]